jgi:hypothetical protein
MRFQQNPLWIRSALAAVFVSPAKPRSRPPSFLAFHNYSSQSFGASSTLLFKAAGTVIYASKVATCPRLRLIAHRTFPIRLATSGVDFVQPSSRSPRLRQSEITLWTEKAVSPAECDELLGWSQVRLVSLRNSGINTRPSTSKQEGHSASASVRGGVPYL